ncbi:HNH endonuclease [Mycobacterium phage Weirdo19]|uniref:HNH endonuclease n=1 Tax=Mycobacterium phage Weirdo19 TaxID=2601610 RepID=A0A6M2YTE1_9CAUD|nr:HNH endonuclease [Mycobacterium phage Weirdo19]QEA10829.1 HNH endonuclease [Mycobacterium phage Weirdo19]
MGASQRRYFRYMNSAAWRARQARYFATHPERCALCGSGDEVELHHHTYRRLGAELDEDLTALCAAHHAEVHDYHRAHDVTLTEATRAVAARFGVPIVVRRPRTELTRKEQNKARKARKAQRIQAQREAAR